MARKVFYSFHYKPDNWRVSQIRKVGAIEGNPAASDNKWEAITNQGDPAIERWIADEMRGRTCTVVMIGSATAGRKWIDHEIKKSWADGLGLVGVHIHNLRDTQQLQTSKGSNPFSSFTLGNEQLDAIVKTYDPPYSDSKQAYGYIANNLADWIEEAIRIRKAY